MSEIATSSQADIASRLYRPVVFQRPERLVPPRSWEGHIPFAFWLMEAIRPKIFVELGTYSGNSYCAFCQAAKFLELGVNCFAVDTWRGDEHSGYYGNEILHSLEEHHNPRYSSFSRLVRTTFEGALEHFSDKSIDLLHIDGCHTYEAVLNDFVNWLPKLSERGVILFHDIAVREHGFGAWKVWEEILAPRYPSFAFAHSHGLGLVAVGREPPEAIRWLCEQSAEAKAAAEVRDFFALIGGYLTDIVSQSQREILAIKTQLSIVESQLQSERTAAGEIRDGLMALSEESQMLRHRLAEYDADRQAYRTRMEEMRAIVSRTKDELAEAQNNAEQSFAQKRRLAAFELRAAEQAQGRSEAQELLYRTLRQNDRVLRRTAAAALPRYNEVLRVANGTELIRRARLSPGDRIAEIIPNSGILRRMAKRSFHALTRRSRGAAAERAVIEVIAASGLFDPDFYKLQFEPGTKVYHPVLHYIRHGVEERRDPHPLFSTRYYLEQNPDVALRGINPLYHFLTGGMAEGRNPHALFDIAHYRRQIGGAVAENPILHYLLMGDHQGHSPHALFDGRYYRETQLLDPGFSGNSLIHFLLIGGRSLLSPHPLFDIEYYLRRYPQVAASGENPVVEYLVRGAKEERSPHPLFVPAFYRANCTHGANHPQPLVQYLSLESHRDCAPHPIFDPGFYRRQLSAPDRDHAHPLLHYLRFGWRACLQPHPLFDTNYYRHLRRVARLPDDHDPLSEFAELGAQFLRQPHPLFDPTFYLAMNPRLVESGENPLVHYLTIGAPEGRDPHPLFDTEAYLGASHDLRGRRLNCLLHYLEYGVFEGRNPNRYFDTSFYRSAYPEVVQSGMNPLIHYVTVGASEGRRPHADFDAEALCPEALQYGLNPLSLLRMVEVISAHAEPWEVTHHIESPRPRTLSVKEVESELTGRYLGRDRASRSSEPSLRIVPARRPRPIIVVSHVSPYPPRAGNEYRIQRIHRFLQSCGFRVILIIAPLPGEPISDEARRALVEEGCEFVLCEPNGEITARSDDAVLLETLRLLHGHQINDWGIAIGENFGGSARDRHLLRIERDFCPDAVVQLITTIRALFDECVILSNYVFMSRFFPLFPVGTLRIIDTHDVFSTKKEKVVAHGIEDSLELTAAEEQVRLERADVVIAIQPEEAEVLRGLAPACRVLVSGVDFDIPPAGEVPPISTEPNVVYVGSNNAMNRKGVEDFLRFAWPRIRRSVPDAQLLVVGRICDAVEKPVEGVTLMGVVDGLEQVYSRAKVVINPSVAGTGLKIKNVEALCRFRHVVTWPSGVDGLSIGLRRYFSVAHDWFDFAERVVQELQSPNPDSDPKRDEQRPSFSSDEQLEIRTLLSAESVYAELREELFSYFQTHEHERDIAANGMLSAESLPQQVPQEKHVSEKELEGERESDAPFQRIEAGNSR